MGSSYDDVFHLQNMRGGTYNNDLWCCFRRDRESSRNSAFLWRKTKETRRHSHLSRDKIKYTRINWIFVGEY